MEKTYNQIKKAYGYKEKRKGISEWIGGVI